MVFTSLLQLEECERNEVRTTDNSEEQAQSPHLQQIGKGVIEESLSYNPSSRNAISALPSPANLSN